MENLEKYYIYRHIRLDTNMPFYIGIGTRYSKSKKYYKRSQKRHGRNKFWKNISAKTEYRIDILFESNDYNLIKEKEVEFISLYGRRDLGLGTLVNLTNGGDHNSGYVPSLETKEKLRQANLGKTYSKDIRDKVSKSSLEMWKQRKENGQTTNTFIDAAIEKRKIKVYQYDKKDNFINEFDSLISAARSLGRESCANIAACCKGRRKTTYGYKWKYKQ